MAYLALLALAALDAAGYSVIAPVLPAISEETGAGPATTGALVGCFALGQLVGYPLAGRGIVRRNASWVVAASLVLVTIGDLGFILGESLTVYFPARFVQGIGAGGLWLGVVFGVLERFVGEEYRRLTGVLAAYSVGAIAGAGIAAVGGIRGPFLLHLVLVLMAAAVLAALGPARERPVFGSDRTVLQTRAFWLAAVAVLLIASGLGAIDGPLPLHLATRLSQAEIAALFVGVSLLAAAGAAGAGRITPRAALVFASVAITAGIAIAGAVESVPIWIATVSLAALGFGVGEAGALGVLLETTGTERVVLAMVVWSQLWGVGYLAGPAVAGALAESVGFAALGLVPLVGSVAVGIMLAWSGARVAQR